MSSSRTRWENRPKKQRANLGRVVAARALLAFEVDGAHVEDALDEAIKGGTLTDPDKRLAWFLALGVLRMRGRVDAALRPFLRTPLQALDPEVRTVLRMGAFEKLYARTPPHAVVHQSVEVLRALSAGRASGMVNAVLRRAEENPKPTRSEKLSHPAWLIARWEKAVGREAATDWCLSNLEQPPLCIVGAPPAVLTAECEPAMIGGRPLADAWLLPAEKQRKVETLPGYSDGWWWIQDSAAVAVADLVSEPAGKRVLDALASPGGKTFRLISRGASVVSVDREDRLALLRSGAERLEMPVELRAHDWLAGPMADELFDAVLVDAPCTGLGTIRRHPGIKWRRQERDIAGAAERQARILRNAAKHVRSGGELVYAVCSVEPEEGPEIVRAFAAESGWSIEEEFTTAPPQAGEDAHYAARMLRP